MLKRYFGLFLSLIAYLLAIVVSLPIVLGTWFTWLSGRLYCWAESKHTYLAGQTILGISIDALRCVRCNKLISQEDTIRVADEVLKLNLQIDDFHKQQAAEKIIEETK